MNDRANLIFLVITGLVISSCSKKSPPFILIDTYAASFFTIYHPGTYWIYQDSTGLITDSEAVTSSICGSSPINASDEECNVTIFSDSMNDNINWQVLRYASLSVVGMSFDVDKANYYENYTMYFYDNNIDITDTFQNPGVNIQKIDTIRVNQFVFYNALKISYNIPTPRYIIIVPNVGIVERLVPDSNYILKLVRYHVVT